MSFGMVSGANRREPPHPGLAVRLAAVVIAAQLGLTFPVFAQDSAKLRAGRTVWLNGGCGGCHGATGTGGVNPDQPAGPALRGTKLDRAALIEATSCGKSGTQMGAWLRGAYTETACYDAPLGPPPPETIIIGAFSAEEISAVVDFIEMQFNRR
jgi:mono/diheme cytochrome c family protein